MKKHSFIKTVFALFAALSAQMPVSGISVEINRAKNFVSYCGTGSRYKSYDDIILTADIELTSDITLRKNLKIRSKEGSRYTISVANA